MSTTRLTWSDYVTKYEEASDLENDIQNDVAGMESGSATPAIQAWYDITQAIYTNSTWQSLFQGVGGNSVKTYIEGIANAGQNFMSQEVLSIQQPNNNGDGGTIPLYAVTGNPQEDDDQQWDNQYAQYDENGYPVQANFFEMISGQYTELANSKGDAYYDVGMSGDNPLQHLGGVNWANGGLNYDFSWDDSGDGGGDCTAFGSLSQWAPYIILTGGDDSALNAALLQA